MGKNKIRPAGGDNQHCPATVFVAGLPYSLTTSQLEEAFSEIGPIRRCFMVTKKGSTEHRGIGFVQFAAVEDAERAIETKNGAMVGGRKVQVKRAMQRAPMEQRRNKGNTDNVAGAEDETVKLSAETVKQEGHANSESAVKENKTIEPILQTKAPTDSPLIVKEKKTVKPIEDSKAPVDSKLSVKEKPNQEKKAPLDSKLSVKENKASKPIKTTNAETGGSTVPDSRPGSDKQRVAKTVIFGGLLNAEMAEDVHQRARECGTICSVSYPLPRDMLEQHGLAKDGCQRDASSVVYTSVKSARMAVAALHQKEIHGGHVWARQLGGEGSKTQKWKLIVRNLPFKATVADIKSIFSAEAFVWDVVIPKNSETGGSKGFAFLRFTSKPDAEKVIKVFNGKVFGKRPIAVDWAVSKKIYSADKPLPDSEGQNSDGSDLEDFDIELKDKSQQQDENDDSVSEEEPDLAEEEDFNFEKELEIAKKVLSNITSTSNVADSSEADISSMSEEKNEDEKSTKTITVKSTDSINDPSVKPGTVKDNLLEKNPSEKEDELRRTIFIINLPFDISKEEVTHFFSKFGEVESFLPVLHRITKRPRGTGFVKFKLADSANAAVLAANTASGRPGIHIKGRQLQILKALNEKEAQHKVLEKTEKEETDPRNLYLAKEGLILEGTSAAEGVSASDLLKRKMVQEKKETKLRSPNFHVSRTRLAIYNLPKSMNENALKQLCIRAVTSRATKQKPDIRQVVILKDVKKGNPAIKNDSRGVAYVEFSEHQHALVALRVLNNNPETFSSEHRPIVEFAIDNMLKLRNRKDKLQAQQPGAIRGNTNMQENDKSKAPLRPRKENPQQQGAVRGNMNMQENDKSKAPVRPRKENPRKRKFEQDSKEEPKATAVRIESEVEKEEAPLHGSGAGGGGANKRRRSHIAAKKENKKLLKGSVNKQTGESPKQTKPDQPPAKARHQERRQLPTPKRKFQEPPQQKKEPVGFESRKKGRKNHDPQGRDVVDKLDTLIEEYTSKFARKSSDQTDPQKQGSKQLRRWFQS